MRIEPLLHPSFKHIMPVKIPRYQKYPYGDNAPMYAGMSLVPNIRLLITLCMSVMHTKSAASISVMTLTNVDQVA